MQQQTLSDFELIVINDGSTDRTLELLQTIKDDRLQVFSYENGGLATARNRGIIRSTGEFIAFLDADDLWSPDKLELQLAALQAHPEAGLVYSWLYNMSEIRETLYPVEPSSSGYVYADLLLGNFISCASNPLLRRQAIEAIGEFCPENFVEDWDYWLRVAVNWAFVLVPKHQVFYRRSASTRSCQLDRVKQTSLITLQKAFESALLELQPLKNQSFSNIHQYYAAVCLMDFMNSTGGDIDQVLHHLWKGISLYPPSLQSRYTQNLVTKTFLIKILSSQKASLFLILFKRLKQKIDSSIKIQNN